MRIYLPAPGCITMTDEMRILVVEDDNKIASFVVKGLKQAGFAVDRCADGEEALVLRRNHRLRRRRR